MGKPPTQPKFMSKRKKSDLTMPESWRNLKPNSFRKSSSRIVVKKRLIMTGKVTLSISALVFGGFICKNHFNQSIIHDVAQNDYTGPAQPVERVIFRSDGALNHKWFLNWMGPIRGLSLAEINLKKSSIT